MPTTLTTSTYDELRSGKRTTILLSAVLRFDNGQEPVRVRDFSQQGARIEGAKLPIAGSDAELVRGSLTARGNVMWREGTRCGLRFDQPLPLDLWLPGREAGVTQSDVDGAIGVLRHSSPATVLTPSLDPTSDVLPARMAEELAHVVRMLKSLEDDLAGEPLIIARHAIKLQYLDMSAQILDHVGAVLSSGNRHQVVQQLADSALRRRLQRRAL